MGALTASEPAWPESTRQISQLRLSMKVKPSGLVSGLTGPKTVHLDIVDYPGEWLLDLPLLEQTFAEWSEAALASARTPARMPHAEAFFGAAAGLDPEQPHDEAMAEDLARAYRTYLGDCRKAGLSGLAPGRFLMPGDLEGSPALTFAPLEIRGRAHRGSLHAEMADRFDAYKRLVVKPFFRNHFARAGPAGRAGRRSWRAGQRAACTGGSDRRNGRNAGLFPPRAEWMAGHASGRAPDRSVAVRRLESRPFAPHSAPAAYPPGRGHAGRGRTPRDL